MNRKIIGFIGLIIMAATLAGCSKKETIGTATITSESNLIKWGGMLNPVMAPPTAPLPTNNTRPSMVSPDIALTKMLQALNSYTGDAGYPLNSVFTINSVNDVVVNGHYYYVGLCEFDQNKPNGATIKRLDKNISCVGVVDAEDNLVPAKLRTQNADGVPYQIKVHLDAITKTERSDESRVHKFVHLRGFTHYGKTCYDIDRPQLEMDEKWNPMFSVTYYEDDGCGDFGTAYTPLAYGLIDAQKATMQTFALDNPITKDVDEGAVISSEVDHIEGIKLAKDIPAFVDWVYSPYILKQMATHAGYNINNYGKRSVMGDLILDGSSVNQNVEYSGHPIIDISLSKNRKDLVMMGYFTSRSNDLAMNQILTMNARTGKATIYDLRAAGESMSVKSLVIQAVEMKGLLRGSYEVQDMTLHTIYGTKTWQGIIARDVVDNENNRKSRTGLSYSVYAMTCWIEASADISMDDIICDPNYDTSKSKYLNHIYRKSDGRGTSTVLHDVKATGEVTFVNHTAGTAIFRVKNVINKSGDAVQSPEDMVFVAEYKTPFSSVIGQAGSIKEGDQVYFVYGDQENSKTAPVRALKRI